MSARHASLAAGRWKTLTLAEQLGNVGSEVSRAVRWRGKNHKSFQLAVDRMLELMDLTIIDARGASCRRELTRTREVLCDYFFGNNDYRTDAFSLQRYFDQFAAAARLRR